MFEHGTPITVITKMRTGTDDYGKAVITEVHAGPFRGAFAPAVGYESTDGRDQVVSQPQAYLPPTGVVDGQVVTVEVTSTSVLLIDGLRYEVDGVPHNWKHPSTGWNPGWQVPLKRAVS